jgi:hypothetical protein
LEGAHFGRFDPCNRHEPVDSPRATAAAFRLVQPEDFDEFIGVPDAPPAEFLYSSIVDRFAQA